MSASLTSSPFLTSQPEDALGRHSASVSYPAHAVDFPKLNPGQFAVVGAEDSGNARKFPTFLDAPAAQIRVFNSFQEARTHAIETIVAHPTWECVILDANRQHVHTIQNGQPIPLEVLLAQQPKSPKAWWQIWK